MSCDIATTPDSSLEMKIVTALSTSVNKSRYTLVLVGLTVDSRCPSSRRRKDERAIVYQAQNPVASQKKGGAATV
jgi:hypothetical protein